MAGDTELLLGMYEALQADLESMSTDFPAEVFKWTNGMSGGTCCVEQQDAAAANIDHAVLGSDLVDGTRDLSSAATGDVQGDGAPPCAGALPCLTSPALQNGLPSDTIARCLPAELSAAAELCDCSERSLGRQEGKATVSMVGKVLPSAAGIGTSTGRSVPGARRKAPDKVRPTPACLTYTLW
jgi:hypothetical protein